MSAQLPIRTLVALAWRNLWRNRERSLVMIGALAIAVASMLFLIAMMRGLLNDMSQQNLRALPGDLQVHPAQYNEDPSIEYRFHWPDNQLTQHLNSAQVKQWSGRIKIAAMISSERESRGVQLVGYLPSKEGSNTFNELTLTNGQWPQDSDQGVVIGAALLHKLDTDLGKRIVLTSQDTNGEIADMGARIIGIYKAPMQQDEEQYLYMALPAVQTWLNAPNAIQEIIIFSADEDSLLSLQTELKSLMPTTDVKRWDELNSYLKAMLDNMDAIIAVLIVVMFITLAFGLVNTLIMAIFERTKEIGLMLALGLKPRQITYLILAETIMLLFIGIAIGDATSGSALFWLRDGIDLSSLAEGFAMIGAAPNLSPHFLWRDLWLCNSIVTLLGIGCSLIPAWRAAHLAPIEAIYHE